MAEKTDDPYALARKNGWTDKWPEDREDPFVLEHLSVGQNLSKQLFPRQIQHVFSWLHCITEERTQNLNSIPFNTVLSKFNHPPEPWHSGTETAVRCGIWRSRHWWHVQKYWRSKVIDSKKMSSAGTQDKTKYKTAHHHALGPQSRHGPITHHFRKQNNTRTSIWNTLIITLTEMKLIPYWWWRSHTIPCTLALHHNW